MPSAVVLKKVLKEFRDNQKRLLEKILAEKDKIDEKIGEVIRSMDDATLKIMKKVLNSDNKEWLDDVKSLSPDTVLLVQKIMKLQEEIDNFEDSISLANHLIQIYDNDKAKREVESILGLLLDLKLFHAMYNIPIEVVSDCFGMAVFKNWQLLHDNKASAFMEDRDIIKRLGAYYNQNGSFKFNEDVETFKEAMQELERGTNEIDKERVNYLNSQIPNQEFLFATSFTKLLEKSNASHQESLKGKEEVVKEELKPLDYEALSYVQNYYKNGEVIRVPSDIKVFKEMLARCFFTMSEQRKILSLINEKLKHDREELKMSYLTDEERSIYEEALRLNLSYLDSNYFRLLELLDNLKVLLDMYLEYQNSDDISLLDIEKEAIINGLSEICLASKEEVKEEIKTNLGFLMIDDEKSFVFEDVKALDPGVRPFALSLLQNNLSDASRGRFQKVKTYSDAFQVYEIFNSRANVFFTEIIKGLFLVLEVNVAGQGYREANRRILKYEKVIMQLKALLQDEEFRETYLQDNALILDLVESELVKNSLKC